MGALGAKTGRQEKTRRSRMYDERSYVIDDADERPAGSAFDPRSASLLDDRRLSKSALRALDVLEYFARRQSPARAIEVAESLRLHTSSADQLLKTLVTRAYLIFDPETKRYHPSPRLLGFATFLDNIYFGSDRLRSLMDGLVRRTGYVTVLSTPAGRHMRLIQFLAPSGKFYARLPGRPFPIFGSAAGSAILATWPRTTVRDLIAQSQDQLGPLAATPDVILAQLSEVRANGHAFGGAYEIAEKCSIAIALPPAKFGTELTLSLRGPMEDFKARRWRLAAMMQEAVVAAFDPEEAAGAA
jgi:DNA-binding IclR family transcriptional regulator